MSLASDAQEFYDFYVNGRQLNGFQSFAGIRRRRPALIGDPPEYEALPAPLEEELDSLMLTDDLLPAMEGDFDREKVMLLDVCAAERVIVREDGGGIEIVLVWVKDYPASEFKDVEAVQPNGRIVTADVGRTPQIVLNECINRLWDFKAAELADTPINARVLECAFEEVRNALTDLR